MMIGLFFIIKFIFSVYLISKNDLNKASVLQFLKTKSYILLSLSIGICISLSLYLPAKSFADLSTRSNIPEYIVHRFKKEKFAETRKAKIRLSNIKIEEFTQVLRGMGKQIK